ncbi:MAG: hypothetical protein KAS04_06155 [Candidatus Aenigmarchaeota archaeon]|nr:hypothetical protein [Candidatus Aenigmarchaeota archaeon]
MEIGIIYAITCSIIWGTMFALSKNVKASQIFQNIWITFGGFLIASTVFFSLGIAIDQLTFIAGLIAGSFWAIAALSLLYSMKYIGIGRSLPLSVSGQIIVSFLWGILFFGEIIPSGLTNIIIASTAIVLVCISAFLVGKTKENSDVKNFKIGFVFAIMSSVFWGTQFVPVKFFSADPFAVMFPFSIGMLATALLIAVVKFGKNINFSYSGKFRNLLNGFMWAAGNYLVLIAIASIGLAKGYVLSQIGVVIIPPLLGIFYFKEIIKRKNHIMLFLATIIIIIGTWLTSLVK